MVFIELACESCEVAVLSFVLVAPSCTAGCARYLAVPAAGDHFLNWTFSGGAGFSPFDERASGGSTSAMLVLLYASARGSQGPTWRSMHRWLVWGHVLARGKDVLSARLKRVQVIDCSVLTQDPHARE